MAQEKGKEKLAARVSRLLGPRELVLESEEFDPVALGPNEISVATEFSAISPGTELAAYLGRPPLRPGPIYPRLVGYCSCGRVLAAGGDVANVRPGDRVVTFACHRSHYRIAAGEIAGVVPQELDSKSAAVAYLFHLAFAALRRAGSGRGSHVAVVGLGALGIATVALAKAEGARVTAVSGRAAALESARLIGADRYVLSGSDEIDGLRAEIIVTTSNRWEDWRLALRVADRFGTIAVLGFPGRDQPAPQFNPLDSQYFYDKQLEIVAVGQLPEAGDSASAGMGGLQQNMHHLMQLMAEKTLPAEMFTRHVRPWSELVTSYEDLASRRTDALTFLLKW